MWQLVKLSEQIRPGDTLACCWDVKQPTNKHSPKMPAGIQASNNRPPLLSVLCSLDTQVLFSTPGRVQGLVLYPWYDSRSCSLPLVGSQVFCSTPGRIQCLVLYPWYDSRSSALPLVGSQVFCSTPGMIQGLVLYPWYDPRSCALPLV